MTSRDFLAVLGAIALVRLAWLAVASRIAATRAHLATSTLVGRTYWSPDMVIAQVDWLSYQPATLIDSALADATQFHPAADVLGASTTRLPRGWVPPGPVIDVPARPERHAARGPVAAAAVAVIAVFAATLLYAAVADASPRHECGEERAAVKLGTDAEAATVSTAPTDTTIAELVALPRPRATAHRAPAELKMWRIHATITAVKVESDGDFHVVVDDGAGHHMIVEIPAPECVGADRTAPATGAGKPRAASVWRDQIIAARSVAQRALHPVAKLRHVALPAVITGVGFYDVPHGQVGVAKNAIELHPVLAIEIGGGQ